MPWFNIKSNLLSNQVELKNISFKYCILTLFDKIPNMKSNQSNQSELLLHIGYICMSKKLK